MSTREFKPYPDYKPSGVEWLGKVPEHWDLARTKFVARVNPSRASLPKVRNDLPVSFHAMEAVGNGELLDGLEKPMGDMGSGYTSFMDNDVLIAKITPSFENGKGALAQGLLNGIGFGTTELHVIRPGRGIDPRYTFYVSLSHSFRHPGTGMMQGTAGQQRVPDDFVTNFVFPLPPLPEQRAIAAFLDRETARIDALVAKRERMIELLQEKRTALISQAVTKGLDPKAPMKDSGVDWLGQIPAHWEVSTVGRHFIVELGKMLSASKQTGTDERKPYLRAANVFWNSLELSDVNEMEFSPAEQNRYSLTEGDLLITEGGVTVGRSAIWRRDLAECYYQNSLNRARALGHISEKYLLFWLYFLTLTGYTAVVADKATYSHLTNVELKRVTLLLPPSYEAAAIEQTAERVWARTEVLFLKVQQAIDRIREYRTALISAAVTGKIDVRGEAQ